MCIWTSLYIIIIYIIIIIISSSCREKNFYQKYLILSNCFIKNNEIKSKCLLLFPYTLLRTWQITASSAVLKKQFVCAVSSIPIEWSHEIEQIWGENVPRMPRANYSWLDSPKHWLDPLSRRVTVWFGFIPRISAGMKWGRHCGLNWASLRNISSGSALHTVFRTSSNGQKITVRARDRRPDFSRVFKSTRWEERGLMDSVCPCTLQKQINKTRMAELNQIDKCWNTTLFPSEIYWRLNRWKNANICIEQPTGTCRRKYLCVLYLFRLSCSRN